jgi:vanillate O-demethylase monooxygenase subunit
VTGSAPGIWIAVAQSRDVGRDLLACDAAGRKLVLYRRESGKPVALDDECWHRLLPLSNGRREGDNVVCAYHGLAYGPDGRCVSARLGRPPPAGAKVRSYQAAEWDGLVWVWADGNAAVAPGETAGGAVRIGSAQARLAPECGEHVKGRVPDSKDGSAIMQAELEALFGAYRDAFIERAASAAAFYSEPCVTARAGVVRVHPAQADLAAFFTEVDTRYRQRGYTRFDNVTFAWQGLGANSVLVTIHWVYKDREGSPIWETTFSYNLFKCEGTWKILMQTMHDR